MTRELHHCRGYALVLVLWSVALLTFVSSLAFAAARTETQLARGQLALLEDKATGEAAIWLAIRNATAALANGSGMPATEQESVLLDNASIRVETRDIAGKINLNYAPRELLTRLLASTSLPAKEADRLGYLIADWVDIDSDSVVSVTEASPYLEAGLDYTPPNRPFSTVDELRLVAGLPDSVFREIELFLTVYGTHAYLNREAADPRLLERLTSVVSEDRSWEARFLGSGRGNIFEMISSVGSSGNAVETSAIVELLSAGPAGGFRILAWDE